MKPWLRICSLLALLAVALICSRTAKGDSFAYVVTPSGSNSVLGTVDLNTGSFSQISTSLPYMRGLGEFGGVLYGEGNDSDPTFYQIDPANGSTTAIGAAGVNLASWFGSTTTGLFALSSDPSGASLYSINPSNGAATLIGPSGVDLAYSNSGATTGGLSVGASSLYMEISTGDTLTSAFYSVNTTTGAATLVGQSSTGTCLKAMAYVSDTLYGGSGYCAIGSDIYTIDPATGLATFVTAANGYTDLNGLAPIIETTSTPEPGTFVLVASILPLCMFAAWSRLRRILVSEVGE